MHCKKLDQVPMCLHFVQQMVKEHWRIVLLLIGLNKGVSSLSGKRQSMYCNCWCFAVRDK